MSEPVTYPAVSLTIPIPAHNKWEREYRAFLHMLPELLRSHRGKYVAVHDGRVVDEGEDKIALALGAYQKFGYVPIYVGLVTERPLPTERIPSFRVVGETPLS